MNKNILLKSAFNASNFAAAGAVFMSFALGSLPGTAIYALTVIIGTCTKYQSLTIPERKSPQSQPGTRQPHIKNFIQKILHDPALTSKILILASAINCISSFLKIFTEPEERIITNTTTTLAWLFGTIGNDAMRKNDKTNFSLTTKKKILFHPAIYAIFRNPSLFFLINNAFFSLSVLNDPSHTSANATGVIVSKIVLSIAFIGILYTATRLLNTMKKNLPPDKINNGVVNILCTFMNAGIAIQALATGRLSILFAQMLYIMANLTLILETKNALIKEAGKNNNAPSHADYTGTDA